MAKRRPPQLPRPARTPPAGAADVRALLNEGARLLMARRPGEAAPLLSRALELEPDSVDAALNLGSAYILQGKHAKAVPVLERAAQLDPHNATVWANLAAAYLGKLPFAERAQQDQAIAAFERALSLNPAAPHVHYNLGLIYLERNDLFAAATHFQAALDTDPADSDARLWLDRIRRGDLDRDEPEG
ncbi:MAG: Cellulose synthase operon protein C precursor [Chloroflexi bacterium ADurb.Bin325]|nr:MAG: Cellulose synthase operon protein C precursor [Chloroflexi bacterium ADurb.Bin325]